MSAQAESHSRARHQRAVRIARASSERKTQEAIARDLAEQLKQYRSVQQAVELESSSDVVIDMCLSTLADELVEKWSADESERAARYRAEQAQVRFFVLSNPESFSEVLSFCFIQARAMEANAAARQSRTEIAAAAAAQRASDEVLSSTTSTSCLRILISALDQAQRLRDELDAVQKATADARSSLDANSMQRSEAARTFAAQEAIR